MRIVIRTSTGPQRELDVTQAVVSAVAYALWQNFGGNATLNWMEAERQLIRLMGPDRPAPGRAAGGRTTQIRDTGELTRTTNLRPVLESSEEAASYR